MAAMTDPTVETQPQKTPKTPRQQLIDDAEYLAGELARGDAVPVAMLVKARPFVETMLKELATAKAGGGDTAKLQLAMIDVVAAIAPVSVSSLRATECSVKTRRGLFSLTRPVAEPDGTDEREGSVAPFSDALVIASVSFLVLALAGTVVIAVLNEHIVAAAKALAEAGLKSCDEAVKKASAGDVVKSLLEAGKMMCAAAVKKLNETGDGGVGLSIAWREALNVIQPVLYGGLGACVYLLRSLHKHIYERTFDRRYKPEYVNRVVLGMVSGGVVTLLVKEIGNIPELAGISAAALAFIIGYNTDLLFSLIERISNALFPKVPDPPPAATTPVAVNGANETPPADPGAGANHQTQPPGKPGAK